MALTVPFLFSNGRCCTEQGGLTVLGNYQLTPSEPELVPCGPLAWGMEVPLCWLQVYIIKKLSYQSVLLPIPCLAFFCLCICVQRPTKMPLEPSWSPFIVDLSLTVLNRAIFLLFSLLTAAMGLFILWREGNRGPKWLSAWQKALLSYLRMQSLHTKLDIPNSLWGYLMGGRWKSLKIIGATSKSFHQWSHRGPLFTMAGIVAGSSSLCKYSIEITLGV